MKNYVLKKAKKQKGTNVYINEHSTKGNNEIAKKSCFFLNIGKLHLPTTTTYCKIFIETNLLPESSRIYHIKKLNDFDHMKLTIWIIHKLFYTFYYSM